MAEPGGGRYKADSVGMLTDLFTRTYRRACELAGESRPMITAEFNTDGDVTGPRMQGESGVRFARSWRDHQVDGFRSISL